MELRVAIDYCMGRSRNKAEFKKEMKKLGYDMIYTPERKYITYILRLDNGEERRVRDNRLNEEKYRKENMDHEFRIRAELYGQAEGKEHTGSIAIAGNTARAHGADQRGGLGDVAGVAQGNATDQRTDGKPGSGLSVSSDGVQADDDGGGAGADGGVQEGYREADQGSRRTGWESERESLSDYLAANRPGRGNLVAKAGTDRHSDNLSLALMGARGAGHLMSLFEDNTEETEEERKERQAQNAAAAAGLALGAATALIQHARQKDEPIDEDPNDDDGWNFSLSM